MYQLINSIWFKSKVEKVFDFCIVLIIVVVVFGQSSVIIICRCNSWTAHLRYKLSQRFTMPWLFWLDADFVFIYRREKPHPVDNRHWETDKQQCNDCSTNLLLLISIYLIDSINDEINNNVNFWHCYLCDIYFVVSLPNT